MKRKWILWIAMILFCVAAGAGNDTKAQAGTLSTRGVWISAFEYEDLGLVGTMSESQFRANAASVFAKVKANGCNTVYFHVRSFDDAIYPSKVVGWSERFTKGKGAPSYDPLKILIDTAHRYGLKFHAWMNPYRVTFKKVLDPAEDTTTDRIVSQVKEIINKYKVDGIHFDDYFYPNNVKKYKKLSKGEKLKFAFAFALAHHPKLLLLDEPGANFDQTFREEFHHILREFTADGTKSVILSTHITSDVDRFADYLLLLKKGRQLLYGDIESVRDAYRMVAGERHALRAFGGRLVYMEETPVGCSALVKHDHAEYDRALKVWEPDTEELMYYLAKGAEHGRGNQI